MVAEGTETQEGWDMPIAPLTIELLAHADAGDRTRWTGDQDARPLSELLRLR